MGCAGSTVIDENEHKKLKVNHIGSSSDLPQEKHLTPLSITQLDSQRRNSSGLQLRATLLIQRWFRRWRAELEVRRRCTWTIFQTMEYANENEQLKLYNFFNEILSNLPDAFDAMQNEKGGGMADNISKLADPAYVIIEPEYDGPNLTLPVDIQQIKDLIEQFKKHKILHAKHLLTLLLEARKKFKKLENVQYINTNIAGKVTIVGDLHGSLDDLLMIFHKNGLPSSDNPYVINGDFVDRGPASVEVSIILFSLFLLYPNSFYLNRGNHEDIIINKRYGFTTELVNKYGVLANRIAKGFEGVFRVLPLITVVDKSILVCHGGISDITDLEYINNIPREQYASIMRPPHIQLEDGTEEVNLLEWRQMLDLLWSDPKASLGCEPNTFRGGGTYFGPDITNNILEKHGFKMLIRSHECKRDGYDVVHGGKVITVFSASNYYEQGSNLGAYIRLPSNHKPQFIQFNATENSASHHEPLFERVSKVESSALRDLRTRIFANEGPLLAGFHEMDPDKTGYITLSDWADCLRETLNLDLPWRTLRPKLAEVSTDGKVKYMSCFTNGGIEANIANKQVTETIYRQRNTLETIFRILDTDNSGFLTRDELRGGCELLAKHCGSARLSSEELELIVDTMDINRDGEVNFNEFLESFRLVDSKFAALTQ